ncbi:MAG: helix-turn-helix transcriptional regulator [Clostridiales bacterium]|nr:helix-turn-helix transcriptional regulator [Clostridiales bacterium]
MKKDITQIRKDLITRFGYIRNRANISAREVSLQLSKSIAYVAKFENGDFNIPTEVLLNAIQICNSTPSEFFYYDMSKYHEHKLLIEKYEKLSEDNKNTIKELLSNLK